MKKRITFTKKEMDLLQHIMWHFSDYVMGDDRPDHGMGILKYYRDLPKNRKSELFILAGKLRRIYRNWQ